MLVQAPRIRRLPCQINMCNMNRCLLEVPGGASAVLKHHSRSYLLILLQARVMSLVNDTVATLAACRYQDQDTMMGVILGTGSNGAYVERAECVQNAAKKLPKGAHMIVNCEWGNLTTDAMPRIDEDRAIDAESVNPENQHFEKMTAGKGFCKQFAVALCASELFQSCIILHLLKAPSCDCTLMSRCSQPCKHAVYMLLRVQWYVN